MFFRRQLQHLAVGSVERIGWSEKSLKRWEVDYRLRDDEDDT